MAESKSLKTAVKKEVKEATTTAKTGNVSTTKKPEPGKEYQASVTESVTSWRAGQAAAQAAEGKPVPGDLPTGARSHPR